MMGCISSKVIARSISFHEEKKQRSQRTTNGVPLLEDLIISTNGSDQYLSLACATNAVSNKLHSKSFSSNTSSKLAIKPASSETTKKLELSARPGQGGRRQFESDNKNRSKSWHCFPEHIVHSLAQENSSGFEDVHHWSSKGAVRSKSFHTVEEYDDMVNKIWLTESQRVQSEFNDEEDDGSGTNMDLQVSKFISNTTHHTEDKDSAIKKMQPPCLDTKHALEEKEVVKEMNILSTAPEGITPSPMSHIPSSGIKNEEIVPNHITRISESSAQGVSTVEKGNKRKAAAKRLESLRIPSNIEIPSIASLTEWLPADGIYSPGSYATPKFGSYSLLNIRSANESSEDSVFSPELITVFEQCMQNLEAEEENILKQIIENVEEEIDEGMKQQERTTVFHRA